MNNHTLKECYSRNGFAELEAERGIRGMGAVTAIKELSTATIRSEARMAYEATKLFIRGQQHADR